MGLTLPLVLGAAALGFLLLLALLWSHWPRWAKAMLVVGVSAYYPFAHEAVHQIWGLPSTDALPARFLMLAATVEEPTPKSAGAIYLWVNPVGLDGGPARLAPRAYRLPYSRPLHEQVNDGLKKGKAGVAQMGNADIKDGQGRGAGWLRPGSDEQEIQIRDLPQPQLPEK